MKKILIVNVNWLGDVIFSSPVFQAIKQQFPLAHVICLAVPRVKSVAESIPNVEEVIVYDEDGAHRDLWGKLKLINRLRKEKFDAAFLLHRSLTRAVMVFLAGIPIRVGYDEKGRGIFLTNKVVHLPNDPHRSNHYLKVIESFGVEVSDRSTILKVDADEDFAVLKLLKKEGIEPEDRFVVVNPGANWALKRWPVKNFVNLIERLISGSKFKVVLSGSPEDVPLAEEVMSQVVGPKPFNLTGKTTLKQLFALMKRAHVVISADSGPLHVANALGTRTVGIFGPTRPEITGPRGRGLHVILQDDVGCNRQACYHLKCADNICMQSITVERVINAVQNISNQ